MGSAWLPKPFFEHKPSSGGDHNIYTIIADGGNDCFASPVSVFLIAYSPE